MAEEEIKSLLYVWWFYYRICEYTEIVETKFNAALATDYYPILKVATYFYRIWQNNYPLAEALYDDKLDKLIQDIEMDIPNVFASREDMACEEEKLIESLKFLASLKHTVPIMKAYDNIGNELAQ